MHRFVLALAAAFLVAPAALAQDATVEDELAALKERMRVVETQNAQLLSQNRQLLEREVEEYLSDHPPHIAAQGAPGWVGATTVTARFTAVVQGTVDYCNDNQTLVSGDLDLDFDFKVTDNLDLFFYTTANTGNTGFPPFGDGSSTAAGLTDGIGVNGTKPTKPGSVILREGGIHHQMPVGDKMLHWEMGELDPRLRFMQNAHANDENTQFISNQFDDTSAMLWLTDSTGRVSLGWHMWVALSDSITINWGWFNTPGQWFNQGQFLFQIHWKGEVSGREMNLRLFGFIDEFFRDATNDGSSGGGASWDWYINDQIGIFATIGVNGGDVNPVEFDATVGIAWTGLVNSRPDDTLGLAVGFVSLQDIAPVVFLEDTEFHLELYWRAMFEDGNLQITPHLIFVSDPNGGLGTNDQLWILGLRIHVPF